MKTNHLIKFMALLLICCATLGCGKENNPTNSIVKYGKIYGTVTDFSSGEPISNANVRLNPRGETTLTGSDGTFQFNDLVNGSYSLSISKDGYADLDDDYVIEIEDGNEVHRDVQIRKNRIHVYGIVTNQYGEPQQNVEVGIYYYNYYGNIRISAVTTPIDGSYDVTFGHDYSETEQCLVRAKKYVNEVGHWCWSEDMYFNVSYEQEFNINPILEIE